MRKTLFKPNVSKTSEVVVQSYSTERKAEERLNDMGKKVPDENKQICRTDSSVRRLQWVKGTEPEKDVEREKKERKTELSSSYPPELKAKVTRPCSP